MQSLQNPNIRSPHPPPTSLPTPIPPPPSNLEVIKTLVRHIPVDQRDNHGRSPLHEATANGQDKAVDLLLYLGADIFAETHSGQVGGCGAVWKPPSPR